MKAKQTDINYYYLINHFFYNSIRSFKNHEKMRNNFCTNHTYTSLPSDYIFPFVLSFILFPLHCINHFLFFDVILFFLHMSSNAFISHLCFKYDRIFPWLPSLFSDVFFFFYFYKPTSETLYRFLSTLFVWLSLLFLRSHFPKELFYY